MNSIRSLVYRRVQRCPMRRRNLLLLCILLLMLLTLACDLGNGGDGTATSTRGGTPTPVPPAAREGMDALNATKAEGLKADCSKSPVWMECP